MGQQLVSFDTDRIKNYVFATGKLKEIRGASAILDELNRWDMVKTAEAFNAPKIYANGGSGMFVVDEASSEALIQSVQKLYCYNTLTGSITGVSVELPDGFSNQDAVQCYRQTLAYRLRVAKDENATDSTLLSHPYMRTCDSCGEGYASHQVIIEEELIEPELLCRSCVNKRDKDSEIKKEIDAITAGQLPSPPKHKLWYRLLTELEGAGYSIAGKNRPDDFGTIGSLSTPKNYMGVIYADGNNMGKELESLCNLDKVENFSVAVDDAIYQAVKEAILKYLPPQEIYFPFDILLLGGDDLVMVVPAHKVIEVAMLVAQKFSEFTERDYGKSLNLSVGVAIAHAKFPFASLLDLAEGALKFAKKESAKCARRGQAMAKEGLVNFIVVSNSNSLEFKKYYSETLKYEKKDESIKYYRTLRPYSVADLRYIVETIQSLQNFPRNKLSFLREALFHDKNQSILDGLVFLNRIKSEQRELFRSFFSYFANGEESLFPWFKEKDDYYTPFLDLIELYDFIEKVR